MLRDSVPGARPSVLKEGRRTVIDFESAAVARIMDAADLAFAEGGFVGAGMDEIASRAGLNKATIYYHVGNKDKLYQEILKRHFSRFADRLDRELAPCADPLEGLRGIVRIHAEEYARNPASARAAAQEIAVGLSRAGPEVHALLWRILDVTRRFVDAAVEKRLLPPVDPVVVHHLLIGPLFVNAWVAPLPGPDGEPRRGMTGSDANLTAFGRLIADVVIPGLAGWKTSTQEV